MNYLKILLCALLAVPSATCAMQEPDEEFLEKKYQAPKELADLLDAAYEQDHIFRRCLHNEDVCPCPGNLPCYVKEFNMRRIKNLEKLKALFKQEKLDELMLPEKYIWRNRIVAERLSPAKDIPCDLDETLNNITKKQFAQLVTLSRKSEFTDFAGGPRGTNVFFSKDRPGKKFWRPNFRVENQSNSRKIAIIDTKRFFSGWAYASDHALFSFFGLFSNTKNCSGEWRKLEQDFNNNYDLFWNKWEHCFKAPEKK